MICPKTIEEFIGAVFIENHNNGFGRNVACWYIGTAEDREWILNAYESFGGILDGISVHYLLDYVRENGSFIIPEKLDDVTYDENCIFGEIPVEDIPKGCSPFDCGYGGSWGLMAKDQECAELAAFEMFKRKHPEKYKSEGAA